MFRGFLSLLAGVLTLICVAWFPGEVQAQRGRGGFRSGVSPQMSRFSPGFNRSFMDSRFGGFNRDFDRRFMDSRFGGFSPGFNTPFIGSNPFMFTSGFNQPFTNPRFGLLP